MGRMMSPDPSELLYADPTNPQSLNLYSYVLNNPLKFIDPNGLECIWDDGSFDSADDKQTGSHAGCSAAGGTYADPHAFSQLNAGDWSGQADSNLAAVAQALGSSSSVENVNVDGSGSIDQNGFDLSSFGLTLHQYAPINWGKDPSLALATGVMSQGIPKLCAVGVSAKLGKLNGSASASGNGTGADVNGHRAGTETAQNNGSGKTTVPIGGPNGTVPFNVHDNGSGPMRGMTSIDAGGTVKTPFGKVGVNVYINVGTYTPNLSDPGNCP
jgi:hypothetical protein